jgi:hypothetical protein
MIDYKTLNALIDELKKKNTSIDSRKFFEDRLGKNNETFKAWRISNEKLIEDGYARQLSGNYIIISPRGSEFEGYPNVFRKEMQNVFVSHAYIDRKIAEKLVSNLLIETIGIPKSNIFFTSKRDTGIPSKVKWREHIKNEIQLCNLFIALITPNYHKSQMCQAELGAAWVLNKSIFSVYLPPIKPKDFSPVIDESQADNLIIADEVRAFLSAIQQDYSKYFQLITQADSFERNIKRFIRSLKTYLQKNPFELG